MPTDQGYLCLIQFCPDRARMVTVNIGLVVFCPALDLLEERGTDSDERAARLFGPDEFRSDLLAAAKQGLVNRLRSPEMRPHSLEELQHFVDTRGNDLMRTPPRSMRITDPIRQADDLFRRLVLDPIATRAGSTLIGAADLVEAIQAETR